MARTSADPGWAETTVRWLRTNHPSYVPHLSKRPANEVLLRALKTMRWHRHEMATFAEAKWTQHLTSESEDWTMRKHADLVKFLEEGGYSALVEKAKEKAMKRAGVTAATKEVLTVTDPATGKTEEIAMDFEEEIEEKLAQEDHAPRSQLSPKHELDEIVASAALASDPRFGVW
jgi:hypothetical protein